MNITLKMTKTENYIYTLVLMPNNRMRSLILTIFMLTCLSLTSLLAQSRDDLAGNWKVSFSKNRSHLPQALKTRYAGLSASEKAAFRNQISRNNLKLKANGTFSISKGSGKQSGTWTFADKQLRCQINNGKLLLYEVMSCTATELVLHPEAAIGIDKIVLTKE